MSFLPISYALNESTITQPQYCRTSEIESTSKLIINLNAVTIKATIIMVVSFCFKLSRDLMLRIFLLSLVMSYKRGSMSEMIGVVDTIAENKKYNFDDRIINSSYHFPEKEDALFGVKMAIKKFVQCG